MPHVRFAVADRLAQLFGATRKYITPVITLRRVGFSVAGTFAFVGGATILNTPARTSPENASSSLSATQTTRSLPADSSGSNDQSTSHAPTQTGNNGAAAKTSTTSTQLTVNGQSIPISANGTGHHTVTTGNSTTTIDTSSTSSSGGAGGTGSSTSFSMSVNSSSSSSSSSQQDGTP